MCILLINLLDDSLLETTHEGLQSSIAGTDYEVRLYSNGVARVYLNYFSTVIVMDGVWVV